MPEYKYVDFYAVTDNETDKESTINTTEHFLYMAHLEEYADKFREAKVEVSELKDLTFSNQNTRGKSVQPKVIIQDGQPGACSTL